MQATKSKSKSIILLVAAAMLLAPVIAQPKAEASDPFIAQITMFGGNFAPRGWAFCSGQLLQISQNSALFSLLGTTFGGDGRTTFGLPDLRGRSPVGAHGSTGPGLTRINLGAKGGAETHTLTVAQMPAHNHVATLHATSTDGNQTAPTNHILANDNREDQYSDQTPNVTMNTAAVTTDNAGGGQSFGIRSPYQGINFIIALVGVFPSRN